MAIRKASRNYNSDYMSRLCDDRLEQLEERLTALYANASLMTQEELYEFLKKYDKQYLIMIAKRDDGIITEREFQTWCNKKILRTERYKETIKTLTNMLVNTDVAAMAIVNNELPFIIAQSYNFAQSLGFAAANEAGLSVGTFQTYNAWTVQKIIRDNPDLLPVVDIPLDKKWNKERINNQITQSILKGDSIPKTAKSLQEVTNMDENSAKRNARTAMTGAENLGRNESIKFMKKNGVPVKFQWRATYDDRTRDTHLMLDDTFQDDDGYFGVGILRTPIEFPGDPAGDPWEIYNCRCRASIRLEGIDHSQDGDLYKKFMQENHPDDYRALKEWEKETGREEAREKAKERQADLRSGKRQPSNVPKEN